MKTRPGGVHSNISTELENAIAERAQLNRRNRLVFGAIIAGVAFANVTGLVVSLGIWPVSVSEPPEILVMRQLVLTLVGALAGFTLATAYESHGTMSEGNATPTSRGNRLQLSFLSSGLCLTIFGVALSFSCGDSLSCRNAPFRTVGLALVLIGSLFFFVGLLLVAIVPRPPAPSKERG